MAHGLRVWDALGAQVWDTPTLAGGCTIDHLQLAGGASGTYTYPEHAGRTAAVQPIGGDLFEIAASGVALDYGVTADVALGYPRVIVASRPFVRTLLVYVDLA
jgi:hypothetical protein